jgi:hypothetical protein
MQGERWSEKSVQNTRLKSVTNRTLTTYPNSDI